MVEACGVVFGYYVLAVGFAEFGELADAMDDDAALFALEHVGKPAVC
jgi:hypothetical protein